MVRSTNTKYLLKQRHEAFHKTSLHYQVIVSVVAFVVIVFFFCCFCFIIYLYFIFIIAAKGFSVVIDFYANQLSNRLVINS